MAWTRTFGLVPLLLVATPLLAGDFDCLITPRAIVDVRSTSEGLIERIWVERGDTVKAGQTLVTLDSGVEKAAVEAARFRATMEGKIRTGESRLELASQKFARQDKLASQSYLSGQDRDQAANEKRVAEAELSEAKDDRKLAELEYHRLNEQLRLRTIKSPVNGVVLDRMLHPGELADNRDLRKPILKLADISTLYVEALLPLEAFGTLKVGQTYDVLPESPVKGPLTATVAVIDRVMDSGSGTFGVRLSMPNPKLTLPSGIKCKLAIPGLNGRGPLAPKDGAKRTSSLAR